MPEKNEAPSFTIEVTNYTTLDGEVIFLSDLTDKEKEFLGKVLEIFIFKKPFWMAFSAFWLRRGKTTVWKGKESQEVTKTKVWAICQDLESRLGLQQGYIQHENFKFLPVPDPEK